MCHRWQPRLILLTGNQDGKALKWLPAYFNFERKIRLLFRECGYKLERRTRDGSFHISMYAAETRPALVASRYAITALFSCRFKCPCLPWRQRHFYGNANRAYNTLHFASKVVCQGESPFGNSRQQNSLNTSRFPCAWCSAFICCKQPRFVVCV